MKRVAAIHDLSCFGRCSLSIALPVLSAMGVQCCPMPTAVLSTHTGGFDGIARTDLTGQLEGTIGQWSALNLSFDGVYTGYMASAEQIRLCAAAISALKGEGGITVVDPVLGDHGTLYRSITPDMALAMAELCRAADVITPNLTEAAFLLGETPNSLSAQGERLAMHLSDGGRRSVVVTGVGEGGRIGASWFDRTDCRSGTVLVPRAEGSYHGTGDLFASVLTGALVRGEALEQGAGRAAEFVRLCVERTRSVGSPVREGVEFEPLLGHLLPGDL